jgi:hypothetical protein
VAQVFKVVQDLLDHKVCKVRKAFKARQALDSLDHRVYKVLRVFKVHLDLQDPKARKEL